MSATSYAYAMPVRDVCGLVQQDETQLLAQCNASEVHSGHAAIPQLSPTGMRQLMSMWGFSFPSRIVVFMNLKGGVGKTTSAMAIGSRAVQYGYKTCVLDLDAQGSAGLSIGVMPAEDDPVFCDVWQAPAVHCGQAIREVQPGFGIIPSGLENSLLDVSLVSPASQKRAVKGVCDELQRLGYELIIVDCPPSLGTAAISAVCAADTIVIPAGNDALSFRGIELTTTEIKAIRDTFGLNEVAIRVLPTKVDPRRQLAKAYAPRFRNAFGLSIIEPGIRSAVDFPKALETQKTVYASVGKSAAKDDYDRVTRIILGMDESIGKQVPRPDVTPSVALMEGDAP